jgi:hypothetical protein
MSTTPTALSPVVGSLYGLFELQMIDQTTTATHLPRASVPMVTCTTIARLNLHRFELLRACERARRTSARRMAVRYP